jgi:hypothetical protein
MDETPSNNPAGDALRNEMSDIMSNVANPLNAGYRRNDASARRRPSSFFMHWRKLKGRHDDGKD